MCFLRSMLYRQNYCLSSNRYAIFDRKVLKKILVREPDKKKSGVSILGTFKKLAEDDITTFVEHGGTKSFGSNLFLSPSFASLYRGTSVASARYAL